MSENAALPPPAPRPRGWTGASARRWHLGGWRPPASRTVWASPPWCWVLLASCASCGVSQSSSRSWRSSSASSAARRPRRDGVQRGMATAGLVLGIITPDRRCGRLDPWRSRTATGPGTTTTGSAPSHLLTSRPAPGRAACGPPSALLRPTSGPGGILAFSAVEEGGYMSSGEFVHLHVHTEYSMLDGAARLTDLFSEAARMGNACGRHDRSRQSLRRLRLLQARQDAGSSQSSGWRLLRAAGTFRAGPFDFGGGHDERVGEDGEALRVAEAGLHPHDPALPRPPRGMHNPFRLSSLASLEGQYRKPRFDRGATWSAMARD